MPYDASGNWYYDPAIALGGGYQRGHYTDSPSGPGSNPMPGQQKPGPTGSGVGSPGYSQTTPTGSGPMVGPSTTTSDTSGAHGPGGTADNPYAPLDPGYNYGGYYGGARDYRDRFQQDQAAMQRRPGVNIDYTQANAYMDQAQGGRQGEGAAAGNLGALASSLNDQAAGRGTSAADYAFQAGLDKTIAAQQSMAASAGGGAGYALAQRNAAAQAGMMQAQGTAAYGQQRVAEQTAARQMQGELYSQQANVWQQQRAQDLQTSGMSAGEAQAQAQAEQNQRQLNDQMTNQYLQAELGVNQEQMQAFMNTRGAANQIGMEQSQYSQIPMSSIVGGSMSGTGAMATMSDVRAKSDVQPAGGATNPYAGNPAPRPSQPMSAQQPSQSTPYGANPYSGFSGPAFTQAPTQALPYATQSYATQPYATNPYAASASQGAPGPVTRQFGGMGAGQGAQLAAPPGVTRTSPNPYAMAARPSSAMAPMVVSDEEAKSVASRPGGETDADRYLAALERSASTYRYKDPRDEPTDTPTGGHYMGVMAQELERVPKVGTQLVKDGPRGKYLEGGANLSASLAGLGRHEERISELERRYADAIGRAHG